MADEPTVTPPSQDRRKCPICGTHNPPDETACSSCGSPLGAQVTNDQYEADEADEPTLIFPSSPSSHNSLPTEEDLPAASQAPTAGPSSSPAEAPTQLDSPLASLPATANAPAQEAQPFPQAVPAQPHPAKLPPTVNTPAQEAQAVPQIKPQPSRALPRGIGLAGGAIGMLLLLFIANTILFQGQDENKNDLEGDAAATQWVETEDQAKDQELAARQPDEANELASLSSADISQLSGQVHQAEELLPLQLYGMQASDTATLKTMLQSHMKEVLPQIQAAYNDSLPTDPQLSGAVVLEFSLTADGRVSRAVGHPTGIENVEFLQAVQSLATQWSFSPIESQTADITVFYPILLTPSTVQSATFLSHLKEVWPGRYKILSATPIPVYNRSGETAEEVGAIGAGLFIYVISSQDGWLGVLSPTGKVGYVRREHLFPRAVSKAVSRAISRVSPEAEQSGQGLISAQQGDVPPRP